LKTYFNNFEPIELVTRDYHYTEWKMVTDDALTKRGADGTLGFWKEFEALRLSSSATITPTDAQIAAGNLKDGATAITDKATLYTALSKVNPVITPQIAAEKIAGPIALSALKDDATKKYLQYARRWYS
jgi:hypothetical protein